MQGARTSGELIARDRELGALIDALDFTHGGPRAAVLEGEAGVGKTCLWRHALDRAIEDGTRVLVSAPAGAEAKLAFAALWDLLDLEIDAVLPAIPPPQRRALEVALLRRADDAAPAPVDERMIGVATLSALRALAADCPLVVAIDDLQWVDAASARALRFALRRLRDEDVLVLAARRVDHRSNGPLELERMLGDQRVTRLCIRPLSLGAVHELLLARLGLEASRATLLRLHELTGGNPFFALEIGRELQARGGETAPDVPLPVPGSVRGVVQARLQRLPARAQTVLLAAALARPSRSLLAQVEPDADSCLDQAIAAGVVELTAGERVRFTHPLFASVHYEQAPLAERRRMHARLSEVVEDLEERASHLALATPGVDERIAVQIAGAARAAASRGAHQAAAELSDLAARLTPAAAGRAERVLVAAEYHHRAGSVSLAGDRAREALAGANVPADRARALAVLGTVAADTEGVEVAAGLYRQGLREHGTSRQVRADLHLKLTWLWLLQADARRAQRHARATLRLAAGVDPATEAEAAAILALVVAARGRPVPAGLTGATRTGALGGAGERPYAWSATGPAALEGVVLLWSGELEEARGPLCAMQRDATESANPWWEMHALAYLSAVETNLGRPHIGFELARRYLELAVAADQDAQRAGALWPLAVSAGWLGRIDEARAAAREGLELAQRTGHALYVIGNLSALGATALSLDEPADAAAALLRGWELMHRGGLESIARFPLADLVEALLAVGELERADALAHEHARIARGLGAPWALALAARCRALVADGSGEDRAATDAFRRALREHDRQARPLDRARTLLAYGAHERRKRQKLAARELLEDALATFTAARADQWARRTRAEIGRIGGRRAAGGGTLSATEAAIARLVTSGRTNREVATALHLSARTVEWNLSKIYRKLGVRSRTQLAAALGSEARSAA